jgi:translation initiation factor 3 subunit M
LKAVETPETLAGKKDVVQRLLDALKENKAVSAQNDKEFEGWSNLILSLVLSAGVEVSSAVETLVAIYTTPSASSTTAPTLSARYAALATLFNALPSSSASAAKLSVLHALVNFTTSNDDVAVLAPVLSALPTIFSALSLSSSSSIDAELLKIIKVLVASGNEKQARQVLEAHGAKTGSLADLQVALSLSASDVYDFSSLSGLTPSSSDLQSLLSIFLRGDVAAFSSASIPKVDGVELSKEQLERKLKLGKLAELCSERVGEQVAYEEVAKALELSGGEDGEEVETWVIDGALLSFSFPVLFVRI